MNSIFTTECIEEIEDRILKKVKNYQFEDNNEHT